MLYLTGTPIGNPDDISLRAVEILRNADYIACEDTRVTGILLKRIGITGKKLISYHEHNKASKGQEIAGLLRKGFDVAQVSDAGMPGISDPGADLAALCIQEELDFTVIPGPTAAMTALVMSGFPAGHFYYEGFLPSSGSERKNRISLLRNISETIILYEAPHRLSRLLEELSKAGFGRSRIALCRELTKKYEEVLRFTVDEAVLYYEINEPRGEFVVCLEPLPGPEVSLSDDDIKAMTRELRDDGLSVKEIAGILSDKPGKSKKIMYDKVLNLLKSNE